MKSHRSMICLVLLFAAFGGCLGFYQSVHFHGGYNSGLPNDGLISREMAAAYCPLWLLKQESVETLMEALRALVAVLGLSISLWSWHHFAGREFLEACKYGTDSRRARWLWLGMGGFAGVTALLGTLSLHVFQRYPALQAPPWLQWLGVLSFAPTLWALHHRQRLLGLQPDHPLSAADFRLCTALLSPLASAPALFLLVPFTSGQIFVSSQTLTLVRRLSESYNGPWPAALLFGALLAGLGLVIGLAAQSRRHLQRGGLLGLAVIAAIGFDPSRCIAPPAFEHLATTADYQLVPLDASLSPEKVRCAASHTVAVNDPSKPRRQMRRNSRLAAQALQAWQPEEALKLLSSSEPNWFQHSNAILNHLLNLRPADLRPAQLEMAYSGLWLEKNTLRPARLHPKMVQLQERLQHSPGHLSSLSGQLSLVAKAEGPVAGARLRLERIPQPLRPGQTPQDWVASSLRREDLLNHCDAWLVGPCLAPFYAQTRTDSAGRFQLNGLESGDYALVLRWEDPQGVRVIQGPGIIHLGQDENRNLGTISLSH